MPVAVGGGVGGSVVGVFATRVVYAANAANADAAAASADMRAADSLNVPISIKASAVVFSTPSKVNICVLAFPQAVVAVWAASVAFAAAAAAESDATFAVATVAVEAIAAFFADSASAAAVAAAAAANAMLSTNCRTASEVKQ